MDAQFNTALQECQEKKLTLVNWSIIMIGLSH